MGAARQQLAAFAARKEFRGKGPLSVALVVTEHAKRLGLPLDPQKLLTEGGGQVLGLGKGAVQSILKRHGITRLLAAEGGRTSRGSIRKMGEYVAFLNRFAGKLDLDDVEDFWIDRIQEFFAAKPFKIKLDGSRSLRMVVRDVIAQAVDRQKTSHGAWYAGTVLQHLVGAKLDCALGEGTFDHNSASAADDPRGRIGDFSVGDVAIHVTTSPNEAVIEKCRNNLNEGYRPMLVTLQTGLAVAEGLADNAGLADRIDLFEIEQFVALNLYELGKFGADGRKAALTDLVNRYNQVVEENETDPSLKIELKR